MRGFIRFTAKYPIASVVAVMTLVLTGAFSLLRMPVDLFPNLEIPVVNIITHYPGAAPEDIETLVSKPIEDKMRAISGVKRVASISTQGLSQVTVEFTWGTTVQEARQLVQTQLAKLRGTLPLGVTPRLENIGTTLQEVCGYVFYGGRDLITLRKVVRYDIVGKLTGTQGVSSIEVLGGDRRAYLVTFRPEIMARLHISIPNLIASLRTHNVNIVAGYVERGGQEYPVRGDARLKTIEDIRSIPIVRNGAKSVLLGEIANVHKGLVPRHYIIHGNGVPAVALIIRKQPGANTINVVKEVDKTLSNLKHLLPSGTSVKKFYDQSEIILEARREILQDLFIGALLAVLVLYFFLGSLRPTLIVAITIPLTLITTISIMKLFNLGFNMITMTALALAVGMIVDDAIVVAENIFRHGKTTTDPLEASIEGTVEIAGPDATGTLTTVAAFLPLIIVTGIASLFLKPFGLTISAALLVSLALSLTVVPLLFSRSRAAIVQKEGFVGDRLLHSINGLLQKTLKLSFKHKGTTVCIALASLGIVGLTAFFGKATILPPIDEGALLIEYVMPPSTSLKESNRIGNLLEKIALTDPDVSCVYRRTGSPASGYQVEGVNRGELFIKLKPKTERTRSAWEIMGDLKKVYSKIPGCIFLYHQPTQEKTDESFSGLPALFGVTIFGQDMDRLTYLAKRIERTLSSDPSISNVINNAKMRSKEIDVHLNYKLLAIHNLRPSEVLTTLQATHAGIEATRIIKQKGEIPVIIRVVSKQNLEPGTIQRLPIVTSHGAIIPLMNVADIRIRHTPAAITRLNGEREVTLIAEVEGSIPKVVKRLSKKLKNISLPQGYHIQFTGQYPILIKTAEEMLLVLLCALILIYLIMAMQFGSWLHPLIILITIPLAMVGAAIALLLTGTGINISVGMGIVTLAGIAVNNAIVLIDYANKQRKSGSNMEKALLEAASVRLRPILLTTLTTIAALLPTAIGTSVGSRIFQPFAITVIGGLLTAVLATLVVVPTLASTFKK